MKRTSYDVMGRQELESRIAFLKGLQNICDDQEKYNEITAQIEWCVDMLKEVTKR